MTRQRAITWLILTGLLPGIPLHADEAAIRKTLTDYVNTVNARQGSKIGSFWTEKGSYTDRVTGIQKKGRAAIQADMTKVMDSMGPAKLSATLSDIRMVTDNVAQVSGETTIVQEDAVPEISSFTAILVLTEGKWLLDSIEEMGVQQPSSSTEALQGLTWLLGNWVDDGGDTKVSTTFRWTANNAFLLRSFDVQSKDGIEMTGTQIIGWDPARQQIRGWSFNSNGSFGESVWSKSGDRWNSKTTQTLADGSMATGTYVLEKLDADSFTIQLMGHELNGEPQPGGPAVKVVRAASEQVSETTYDN